MSSMSGRPGGRRTGTGTTGTGPGSESAESSEAGWAPASTEPKLGVLHPSVARGVGVARRALLGSVAVGAVLWLFASPARAHSFLVGTDPAQGERLAAAPSALVLEFSEAVDLATVGVQMTASGGAGVEVGSPEPHAGGLAIRGSLPEVVDGIYVVAWAARSAVDGHGSSGEFAFAVGDVRGVVPAGTATTRGGPWSMAAGWAFFAGYAAAAGGLVIAWLWGSDTGPLGRWVRPVVRLGLLVALAGAATAWVALPVGGSTSASLLALATMWLLALAALLYGVTSAPFAPLAVVFAAAATWSARSHAAASDGLLGGTVDFIHLAVGGLWAGLLVVVTAQVWVARRRELPVVPVVRRYARVALWLVVVLAVAGVASALQLLTGWSDLVDTAYGRLILVKTALFGVAVALAALARWRGLARHRLGVLRRAVTIESVVVALVLVLAGVLVGVAPPLPASAAAALLGLEPLEGTIVRDAGLAGQLNVEVATDGRRLDITVFAPSAAVPGTEIEAALSTPGRAEDSLAPRPCGPGCFTQALRAKPGVTMVRVDVTAPGWTGGSFEASLAWPPGSVADGRLDTVLAAMRSIPTLELTETTSSGPGSVVRPLTFTLTGARFVAAEPYAGGNVEARSAPGDPDTLQLYLPGSRIFVVLRLDDRDRITAARLVTPGHEIERTFRYPVG